MKILHRVNGEVVRLSVLPACTSAAVNAFRQFVETAPADILGLDVESTAFEELGTYDPGIKMRLIQFGTKDWAWALPPEGPWREHILWALRRNATRYVSHNASFDTTRVLYEFGIDLGERSLDTLPMAALLFPGRTAPKGLKDLSDRFIDTGLSEAELQLHARMYDLFFASKPRKSRLLPASFKPGVSQCRAPRRKGQEKCSEPSWEGSLVGYCHAHYLDRARKKNKAGEVWGWKHIPLDDPLFLTYAGLDAVYVRRLLDILATEVKEWGMAALSRTEQRVKRYSTGMSQRGMRVDLEWTQGVLAEVEKVYNTAEGKIIEMTGFKARSTYLRDWLHAHGVMFKKLDAAALPDLIARHGHREDVGPVLRELQVVSKNSNLLTNLRITERAALEGDGFVHPNVNTMQAHTGRMSVTKPAMQTLAKKGEKGRRLRGCYIAREGYSLVGADYDSQEIRIAAGYSQDPVLLDIVLNGKNQHNITAESLFENWTDKEQCPDEYAAAKKLDFGLQYGEGPRKLAPQLEVSLAEATEMWKAWRRTYAGLVKWSDKMSRMDRVRNDFGRVIPKDPFRQYANGNYMIQSTGRDVLGEAMCRLADAGWAETFWLPVHDELVLEVPDDRIEEAQEALTRLMSTTFRGIPIPAEGELIGKRWAGLG